MVSYDDVKASVHNSDFQEKLLAYLEPSNLYNVLADENDKAEEAHLTAEINPQIEELERKVAPESTAGFLD